jgi:hypothetical protein
VRCSAGGLGSFIELQADLKEELLAQVNSCEIIGWFQNQYRLVVHSGVGHLPCKRLLLDISFVD